jgi:hypothetical protein
VNDTVKYAEGVRKGIVSCVADRCSTCLYYTVGSLVDSRIVQHFHPLKLSFCAAVNKAYVDGLIVKIGDSWYEVK